MLHGLRLGIAILLAAVSAWATTSYFRSYDLTQNETHTLSAASIAALEHLSAPVTVTAYFSPQHAWRKQVQHLVDRYRRHKGDLSLEFIDPRENPETVRAQDIREGDLVISSGLRQERTNTYSEQAFTETLARLARLDEQWIVFASGHGERSPAKKANHDVSDWAGVLEKRGFKVQTLNLVEYEIPTNTGVLVIASAQIDYQSLELAAIKTYVEAGGNLLFLLEPETPPALGELARTIGISLIPGTIVDPLSLAHGIDNPAFILVTRYNDHQALEDFEYTSVFFHATGLLDRAPLGWESQRLMLSSKQAWSETDALEGNVAFEQSADFMGPLPLGLALTRQLNAREQRIVAMGDGDFLANAYLQNSGNQDLGVRLIEWLAHDDAMISVPTRTAEDNALNLAVWHQAAIGFMFLVALPALFALNGLVIWWRRRRA